MSKRITIDPITRIEGHLRIDVDVDGGRVTKAWSSGQMWRGVELILLGRDPRDAWAITQRICGVCTTVHAITSVRAVENALKMEIPLNAQYIRNIIILAHSVHDFIVHFYHLSALDWVDVTSALKADPDKTAILGESLSSWHLNSKHEISLCEHQSLICNHICELAVCRMTVSADGRKAWLTCLATHMLSVFVYNCH